MITFANGAKQLELLYGKACPDNCILIKQGLEATWAPGSPTYRAIPDKTILITGRNGNGVLGRLKIRLQGTDEAAILATTRALRSL